MPSGNVTIVMKAADAELLRAWQRARQGPAQYEQELRKVKGQANQVKQSSEGLFRTMSAGFGRAATSVLGVVSPIGMLNQAVRLLRQEYDELIKRQGAAAQFQMGVAGAQRAALRNLGSDMTAPELQSTVGQIAGETGADQATLYNAAAGVLSARGKFSSQEALSQLAAVTRLDPTMAPQDLQSLAGATLDVRKAFGGMPEQAIGALLVGQQTSRVEDTGQYARNIVPALTGLKNFGQEFREANALTSAISQISDDVEGARSGTASIQFAKEVTEATLPVKELQGKGLTERLEYLRTGQERGDKRAEQIRRSLVGGFDIEANKAGIDEKGKLTGEAKQYTAMIGLLTRGSDAMGAYENALSQTPKLSEANREYERNLENQRQVGIQATARTGETFRGAQQRLLSNERAGLLGATKQGLEDYLEQIGTFGQASSGIPASWHRGLEILALENTAQQTGRDPRRLAAGLLEGRASVAEGRDQTPASRQLIGEMRELERKLLREALDDNRRRIERGEYAAPTPEQAKEERRRDEEAMQQLTAALDRSIFKDLDKGERNRIVSRIPGAVSETEARERTAPLNPQQPANSERIAPLPAAAAPKRTPTADDAKAEASETAVKLLKAALGPRKGTDDEIAQLRRELANQSRILQEIARNTADKTVRVANANEPRRAARRASVRPAPIKQAGGP